jgi:hypothetical protein
MGVSIFSKRRHVRQALHPIQKVIAQISRESSNCNVACCYRTNKNDPLQGVLVPDFETFVYGSIQIIRVLSLRTTSSALRNY